MPAHANAAACQSANDQVRAATLFASAVRMVEVEVSAYCNRRCWFCSNVTVDRLTTRERMSESMYLRILRSLREVSFSGLVSYSRYNEPLADRIILTRLRQASCAIPNATLHANTNGDFLTPAYLDNLEGAGLRSLNVQIYLGNDVAYDHARARRELDRVVARLGLEAELTRDDPGTWLEARAIHGRVALRVYARNFAANGCSRGDLVPIHVGYRRTAPCVMPLHHVYIDYAGRVTPCCNLRADFPGHQDAIVGDLAEEPDLLRIFAGERLAAWRKHLTGSGPKQGLCASCSFLVDDVEAQLGEGARHNA